MRFDRRTVLAAALFVVTQPKGAVMSKTTKNEQTPPKTKTATDELPDTALDKVAGGDRKPDFEPKGRI